MAVNGSKAGFLLEFPTGDSSSRPSLSRTVTSPEGAWFTLCECSPRSSFCTPWKQQETTAAWRKFHGTPPPFHKLSVCQKIILHVWLLISGNIYLMCTCGAFCGRLWQSPVKEMIQVQGFGSEKVLQLLYGERMRCHLLDSKWRSEWGRPSPPPSPPSPPSPWLYNNCICIMTIFFPTFFPKQCVMTMKFWQCLKFRDVFSQTVLITSLVSCVCLKMWHTPKSQLDLGKVNGKVTPPKKKINMG